MHKIRIQKIDHDDYPQGQPTNIGPFDSEAHAETWLDESGLFRKVCVFGDYFEWRRIGGMSRETINIEPVDYGLYSPEDYLRIWKR